MSYIAGHKKLFGIDMLCALLVALIDLIFPYVSRYSMKVMLPNKLYATFFTVMAVMVLAYVLRLWHRHSVTAGWCWLPLHTMATCSRTCRACRSATMTITAPAFL